MRLCSWPAWRSLCEQDPSCTFFQTPSWLRVTAEILAVEPAPLAFSWSGGSAVLPMLRRRRGPWNTYFSPFGTYSALVSSKVIPERERSAIAKTLARLNISLASSPFTANPVSFGRALGDATAYVPLEEQDADSLLTGWDEDARRRLRVAERSGIAVGPGDCRYLEPYYELYRNCQARWGEKARTRHPFRLFGSLFRKFLPSGAGRLWVAESGGRMVAGCLAFYHGRIAHAWSAAVDSAFFRQGVMPALFAAMIRDAKARGFGLFDFGPSGGLEGVARFKESFGTRTLAFRGSQHLRADYAGLAGAKRILSGCLGSLRGFKMRNPLTA